ncbi:FAD-dependent oxidoreductase [Smaragdicoccus niigatensis]|uniref:FAD-dependent oxidoreductase n=1 Tax=Smaragdicoccus niigatensis TaxID=359359 RepID=UPI00037B8E18|nr:FAD-dependent oxidoreductase [Smaragdicoccus niigatensis]
MAYVITQSCCNDASCVGECPVDCIRPTPDDPEFATTEMLYIDPETCIDCGACVDACPVDAIFPEYELTVPNERYLDINADYFQRHPLEIEMKHIKPPARLSRELGTLRVAIVGAGPAGCYAAQELRSRADVEIEMLDRLPTPLGLIRAGVAPDHPSTKGVADVFESVLNHVELHLNVEVGQHVSHEELLGHCHAVIYAVGASTDRHLGIPGEDLPGSHSATEFVAWYNGHPDYVDRTFDFSGERAVIIGNGNVALDVARILTLDPDELARTDIADHALKALRDSKIREVVVLGRRGPEQAAYSTPEFLALSYLPGVDVIIDPGQLERPGRDEPLKVQLAREYAAKSAGADRKRIVFRYLASPVALTGGDHVAALEIAHNELIEGVARPTGETETLSASLVLRSVGYRGEPIKGLPFDDSRGLVPNANGRVETVPGAYVTGWIKRGPRGVIGSNRIDAKETVEALLADFASGVLQAPPRDRAGLRTLLDSRQPQIVDRAGWRAIDQHERELGRAAQRPRVKLTTVAELLETARRR